ncbi:MAG TPA: ATP-binding protein [Candidatus Limnocylindrales bacterium]|nr:ATP-binding protein [Candidatus Limnocylindrales bacterium]
MRLALPQAAAGSVVPGPARAVPAVSRRLVIAVGAASGLTALAALLLVVDGIPGPAAVLPILVALAGIVAALLARRAAPGLAWVATIAAALAAAGVPIAAARGLSPVVDGVAAWELAAGRSSLAAIVTLGIAAAYATRPERRLDPIARPVAFGLLAWLGLACAVSLAFVAAGDTRSDPAFTWVDVATAPISWFINAVLAVTALGVAADLRAAVERARDAAGPVGPSLRRADDLRALAVATVRELVPGMAAADAATVAAERSRLAGDLHAVVLPSLRRAIAEAESGGDAETLARHLRTVDLELERLMADRWPVVLEAFGLVAALEDLAERIEADGGPAVEIDIGPAGREAGERPPPAVERVAWRVAQLAVDNALRHATPSTVRIRTSVSSVRVDLTVADDGTGFDPAAPGGIRPSARGLADATRRAASVGGGVVIEAGSTGGTVVRFHWPDRL